MSDELRRAIEYAESYEETLPLARFVKAILEGDDGLVERIAVCLLSLNLREPDKAGWIWEDGSPVYREGYLAQARAVLAALIEDSA